MRYREGETARLWFRTGREFHVDGQWYFATREGIDVGPYPTQVEAQVEAALLLRQLENLPTSAVLHRIRDFAYQTVAADGTSRFLRSDSFTDYLVRESSTELTAAELFS
ncbi:MAG: DUF6316 family protein [Pseudomonadota bacterium]